MPWTAARVCRTRATTRAITGTVNTANGTATAGSDYVGIVDGTLFARQAQIRYTTGNWSLGTGTTPQCSQWITGIGVPQ